MTTALALPEAPATPDPLGELIPRHTAQEMAKTFCEATAEIDRLIAAIHEQTTRLNEVFELGEQLYKPFNIKFHYGSLVLYADRRQEIMAAMKRRAWEALTHKLGLHNLMSIKRRNEFDAQLEHGELPDINEGTIVAIILGLCGQAQDFAKEAAKEVFDLLRPAGRHGGQYKTNDAFRVGRRVILPWRVEASYGPGKFRPTFNRERELIALDGVFHLLDGKGVMREHAGPLCMAIKASPDGHGETEYFKFKCYKNGNLHLEMKRLDLVMELNLQAVGERVLGDDP